ncbi:MAG: cohesin domain-containing protein, partial [Clostridiaceae bacterium]|nr:cohesin domain-containing protein [Clostridiaceae bacterium]
MKKILSVLVAVLLVSLACVPAFAADTVTINPSATEAAVGDEITISVDVEAGLTGANIVLKYDADYLEYVEGSAAATDVMTTELNDTVSGEIAAAGVCTDPCEAGTLFTAKFKVKKANAQVSADANEILDDTGADIAPGMTIAPVTIGEKAGGETTTSANGGEATTSANGGNGGNG